MRTINLISGAVAAFFLLSFTGAAATSQAQRTTATATAKATAADSSNVVITFPLIVSELHGTVEVKGTADLPGMRNYFLELHLLNDDATLPNDDTPWVAATLPVSNPVQAGFLANWDTTLVPDGLYALRLTVTKDNEPSVYYVDTPLRVGNAAFSRLTRTPGPRLLTLTPTAVQTGLALNGIVLNPAAPICGSTFTVTVNVNNPGNAITAAGAIYVQDIHVGSGTVTATGSGTIPDLNPGANFVVTVPLTVLQYYNEVHEVRVNIASSQIVSTYTLAQGSCNMTTVTPQLTTTVVSTLVPGPTVAVSPGTTVPVASATTVPPTAAGPTRTATTAAPTATLPAASATTVPATAAK